MNKLQKIVDDINYSVLQKKYAETIDIISEVSEFIKKKKLLLYGGYALNLLLPKKDKFYKDFTMNDYDCLSPSAKADATELSQILSNKNYEYIKIKHALHENTFKVYVNFVQILDITQIPRHLYNKFLNISESERSTPIYNYYKGEYLLAPIVFLKSNLHYELSRPLSSYFRWEKIYKRSLVFSNIVRKNIKSKPLPQPLKYNQKYIKHVVQYIKDNDLPIVNDYTFRFFKLERNFNNTYHYLQILSLDIEKTKNDLLEILHDYKDINVVYFASDMFKNHYTIEIDGFKLIKIVNAGGDCFSYKSNKGFKIGSYDCVLYFLYMEYLLQQINGNNNVGLLNAAIELENHVHQNFENSPQKRLETQCYGANHSLRNILVSKWKKKQTIKYY